MKKKVVICGIDTSTLPRLSSKEAEELMIRVKSGDVEARDTFIMCNLRLVLSILKRYSQKVTNIDDLFQVGCVGLVKSVDNFDNSIGVKFSTYAVPMIVGEIRRYLRESNSMRVSRGIRDTAYSILTVREEIEGEGSHMATLEEIACRLNKTVSEVVYALDAISQPMSLYEPIYSDENDSVLVMDQIKDEKNTDENWITGLSLSAAIELLNERERSILTKRYYEGKTQIEVSSEVGISQAQVSRLEKNAVSHIRKYL